jgi:hypothetical protein
MISATTGTRTSTIPRDPLIDMETPDVVFRFEPAN